MALQHLRSSTANKRPLPAGMSDGQLAINTNATSPGLFFKDSNGNLVKTGPVHVGTTAPNASPASGGATGNSTGELWLDTSVSPNQLKTWNGSAWVSDFPDEIPVAKLADGAARQLLQTDAAGTGVEWTSNVDVPGTLDVTSTATFDSIAQYGLGSAGAPTITFVSDNNTGIYSPGADQLALSTNGTGRLFVDASGRVGLNEANPGQRLVVGGDMRIGFTTPTDAGRSLEFDSNRSSAGQTLTNISFLWNSTNVAQIRAIAGADTINKDDAELAFFTTPNGSIQERLRITSAGLVGVGTSSPNKELTITSGGDKLQLFGLSAGSGAGIFVTNNGYTDYEPLNFTGETITFNRRNGAFTSTQAMIIDSSGRVGIGTSSPETALTVRGEIVSGLGSSINGTTLLKDLYTTGASLGTFGIERSTGSPVLTTNIKHNENAAGYVSTNTLTLGKSAFKLASTGLIYATAASSSVPVGDAVALTDRFVITNAGLVGIGTTSPGSPLTVEQSSANINLELHSTSSGRGTQIKTHNDHATFYHGLAGDTSGNFIYYTADAKDHVFSTNNTERARIDSSGRLLVGTSSARTDFFGSLTANVQVEGSGFAAYSCYATAGNGAFIFGRGTPISGSNIGTLTWQADDGTDEVEAASIAAFVDGTPGANDMPGRLVFSVTRDGSASPTEAVRINSSGYLKCTSNGSYDNAAGSFNEMYQTNNGYALLLRAVGASTYTNSVLNIGCDRNTSNSTYNFIDCGVTGIGARFFVRDSGNVENANNSYGGISDLKLKENIVDASSQWDDIKALRPVNYNFKEGQTHTQLGLIAQEVELVSPGLVSESPDRDEDGNDLGTVTKSVNYSVLYMKAVKALQEAMERIEQLEAKVAALEAL